MAGIMTDKQLQFIVDIITEYLDKCETVDEYREATEKIRKMAIKENNKE